MQSNPGPSKPSSICSSATPPKYRTFSLAESDIPPLPAVAWKILEMTSDLYCGASTLEEVLSRDQAITGRVLRLANSVHYAQRCPVTTVTRAAAVVGNRRLRSLVVAVSLEGLYNRGSAFGRTFWEHSLLAGIGAQQLAMETRYPDPEEAFIAGLLHDIGKSILEKKFPDFYGEVSGYVNDFGWTVEEAEHYLAGQDHTQVGEQLCRYWKLAPPLAEAIQFHKRPELAVHHPQLCRIVQLADVIAETMGADLVEKHRQELESLPAVSALSLDPGRLEPIMDEIRAVFEKDLVRFGLH